MIVRSSCSLRQSPNNGVLGRKNLVVSVIPLSKARVVFRTPKKARVARPRHAGKVCARGQQHEGKRTAENPLDVEACARIVAPGYVDPDVLDIGRDSATALRDAINVSLAISASEGREKWALLTADVQAATLKGEFRGEVRVCSRGKKAWRATLARRSLESQGCQEECEKKHGFSSILDSWQNDETFWLG